MYMMSTTYAKLRLFFHKLSSINALSPLCVICCVLAM